MVIHMDPLEVNDTLVIETKEQIKRLVKELDPLASIHDFRMVNGEESMNLIFDLEVPHNYSETRENLLIKDVKRKVKGIDPRYHCDITLEHGFIGSK